MPTPTSRNATPHSENDPTLSTPRAKPVVLLSSRRSMNNITNSVSSKRILPTHLQSETKQKRVPSDSLTISAMSPTFASNATPQPRRKRTDTEPATITPRPKTFLDPSSDIRKMQSVSDISRLTVASSTTDDSSKMLDIEPVKAYLRIRPPPQDAQIHSARPYIEVISQTEVLMHPPAQTAYNSSIPGARSRTTSIIPPTKYIFSKVFGSHQATSSSGAEQDMSQSAFFHHTTLPLVEALLQGESGLMFTYGVTNSGKSHTVMGNTSPGGAGILPRALDVIFNSIQGLESTSNIQPMGVSGVQRVDNPSAQADFTSNLGVNPFMIPSVSRRLLADIPARTAKPAKLIEHDTTKVPVDRNLRYSVFVSYVEIYNEKLFDLLDVSPGATLGRSESVRGSNWSLANMANAAPSSIPSSASITLNRKPLSLKNDHENGGKYVAGLREIKINSAQEARDLLHRGQENRAVFGTMANRASSRSHGIFTIKVVRHHGGITNLSVDDLDSFTTARLSIVDLAGSERVANTGLASGDRLKEAGNINKSLMCLGQCLETLRKNQVRLMGTTEGGQAQTVKRRVSIVPFRHSKLTELFQSFFVGEGKAVMIVNANPYDTGFDENSHVMKFSAIAKEVAVPRHMGPVTKTLPPLPPHKSARASGSWLLPKSGSTVEVGTSDSEVSADVTIVEDDEESGDEDHDPFVDMLVERHEELRQKLYAAELRCATIEAQVRQEMGDKLEQTLLEMQDQYNRMMMNDAEQNAQFMNRKIDLLVGTNARHEPELVSDSDVSEEGYEFGHDEAEVEGDLSTVKSRAVDHSMSDFSGAESVFDDATEGEFSNSLLIDSEAEGNEEDSDDESAILETRRSPTKRGGTKNAKHVSSEESLSEEEEEETQTELESDQDANVSSAVSDAEDEESGEDNDSDEEDEDEGNKSEPKDADEHSQVYVEIPADLPDGSFDSVASSAAAKESDSDFDLDAESADSEEERLSPPRRKSGRTSAMPTVRASNGSIATARARRSSAKARVSHDSSIIDQAGMLTDLSDASMVMEETVTPKKKRKLRKKAAMQEDDYVEQIGDSSLVEAVYQNTGRASGASRASRSLTGRKSFR
ncbi:related to Kinesin-like protein KIF23 [Melanopsichium pennsylvanicum]|uniref:Related to Kinesin-like protein KIF23 n=2 Tax=Melanopsichium pennsylvanicum TaxID=63383 RepID=A0AAJ4XTB1_9BASI|nr:related to Kinesin-like protein KIF23 [Melanopsichium pennsylvanicum 4]SNX87686.1 related to Kinesin-like protein KIF23 [Melanopsichium pennsylvanicum]